MEFIITNTWCLYLIALVGMVTHFLKKSIKGETLVEIKMFFSNNIKSTIIALISTTIGFLTYIGTLEVDGVKDVMIIFGIGYMCDSFLNKWEK